jgi:predicted 3-demethylubiquinone-9 3-methyltransferase (glyoxalase superfamily)
MQEAVNFYMSVFNDARVVAMNPAMATFELLGQRFLALNAHPHHKFNDAVSFFIDCDTQAEVDYYWDKLAEGGGHHQCGWLKDRFGLSWQVIPKALGRFLMDEDREKENRVMQAMLKMKKIVIADLEAAYKG